MCTLGVGEAVGWGHRALELDQNHLPHAKRFVQDVLAITLGRCLLNLQCSPRERWTRSALAPGLGAISFCWSQGKKLPSTFRGGHSVLKFQ